MKKFLWIAIALVLVLSGCELFNRNFYQSENDFPDPTKGAMVLLLSEDGLAASKTIKPPDLDVAQYDMVCTHDTIPGTHFEEENWQAASAYTKNGLAPGIWTLTLVAEDSTGFEIGAVNGDPALPDPLHDHRRSGHRRRTGEHPTDCRHRRPLPHGILACRFPDYPGREGLFGSSECGESGRRLFEPRDPLPRYQRQLDNVHCDRPGDRLPLTPDFPARRHYPEMGFWSEYVRIVNGVQTSGTVGLAGTGTYRSN